MIEMDVLKRELKKTQGGGGGVKKIPTRAILPNNDFYY